MWNRDQGNRDVIVMDDAFSERFLGRPWIPIGLYPTARQSYTGTAYETAWWGANPAHNAVAVIVVFTYAGTGGGQVKVTMTPSGGSARTLAEYDVAANTWTQRTIEAPLDGVEFLQSVTWDVSHRAKNSGVNVETRLYRAYTRNTFTADEAPDTPHARPPQQQRHKTRSAFRPRRSPTVRRPPSTSRGCAPSTTDKEAPSFVLPENIPSVTVRGRFLDPSGRPLSGAVTFRAPAQLTFPQSDVILGGPVVAQLDAQGSIEVTLPATDAPDMDPSGWAYIVAEQLAGIPVGRTYNILLPTAQPLVDLADIAPTDPSKPNYVGVPGPKGDTGPAGAPAHGSTPAAPFPPPTSASTATSTSGTRRRPCSA